MVAVRHRQLIQGLAIFAALDMAVGVVALSARRGDRHEVRTTLVAGSVGIPLNDTTGTGVLAGANLKKRRSANDGSAPNRSVEAAPTTRAPAAPSSTATSTPAPVPGPAATPTSTGSPSTTITRPARAERATPEPTRGGATSRSRSPEPTTAPTRSPEPTTTTRSGPVSSTTASTRPSTTTAPTGATTTTSQPPAAGQPRSQVVLDDPAGDTFVDGSGKALKEPRADIVRAGVNYRSDVIAFAMQVQQAADPRTDEKWAGDATFAQWTVDTNGDGQGDFEIQYYVIDGQLGGAVSKPNSADVLCGLEATWNAQGYSAIVDPACLGKPESVTFRAAIYYDTNPKDENADVASDVTPDGGMSYPASRPS